MKFLTLKDMDLEKKRVLVRVDFNVPLKNGEVTDDIKLKATVPTLNYLLEKNCKIILMSHLGRPQKELKKGKSIEEVKKKLKMGVVDTLLISEIVDDEKLESFEKEAKMVGTKVKIISTETREGVQLKELGKIAAILRYEVK